MRKFTTGFPFLDFIINSQNIEKPTIPPGQIELRPVELDPDYAKKWNVNDRDFVNLYKDGVKVSDTLYRVGGIGIKPNKDSYFMLLKYVEAFYDDNITKKKDKKPHLESQWCILDNNGVEKVNFSQFQNPNLKGGQIYYLEQNYYNIETGEFYCRSHTYMATEEFLFLNNEFDGDHSRRGVMKINKNDGTWELFKQSSL